MKKKNYVKPSMTVVGLKPRRMLMKSNGEETKKSPSKYNDEFGYIPGLTDENLA
jgi:hypothetical protein